MSFRSKPPELPDLSRRHALSCMGAGLAGGVVWSVVGGVPCLLGSGEVAAAEGAFTFAQVSDTHIGFTKDANPDPSGTLTTALGQLRALKNQPRFILHTGDVTHLSKPAEFEAAAALMQTAGADVHYVPGEHDVIDDDGAGFFQRFGKHQTDGGWYSFDAGGIHFVGLVNVVHLAPGGLGSLGAAQLEWLTRDLKDKRASTPIVVFAHMPMWPLYAPWGWGTDDSAFALGLLKRFGSVTVLNGHVHQVMQKVEGNVTFQTARSTAFPQPAPGEGPGPGPMKVAADKLKSTLGIREIDWQAKHMHVTDRTLDA